MLPSWFTNPEPTIRRRWEAPVPVLAGIVLNVPEVRIERGYLTLTAIAPGRLAILLNPIDAPL